MKTLKTLFLSAAILQIFCSTNSAAYEISQTERQSVTLTPHLAPTKRYEGSLAGKRIVLMLSDRVAQYTGGYVYITPTSPGHPLKWIELTGKMSADGTLSLLERVDGKLTGEFKGQIKQKIFSGVWSSPKGKKFDFSATESDLGSPKFIAEVSTSPTSKKLTKITVYQNQKLLQSIAVNVNVYGPIDSLHYDYVDYNFDGYPDFSLSSTNSDHLYLLFDAAKNSYVMAPESLQDIDVTATHYSTNEIIEEWGGNQERGLNVYKFVNGKYCLVEETTVSGPAETAKASKKTYPVSQCKSKKD